MYISESSKVEIQFQKFNFETFTRKPMYLSVSNKTMSTEQEASLRQLERRFQWIKS